MSRHQLHVHAQAQLLRQTPQHTESAMPAQAVPEHPGHIRHSQSCLCAYHVSRSYIAFLHSSSFPFSSSFCTLSSPYYTSHTHIHTGKWRSCCRCGRGPQCVRSRQHRAHLPSSACICNPYDHAHTRWDAQTLLQMREGPHCERSREHRAHTPLHMCNLYDHVYAIWARTASGPSPLQPRPSRPPGSGRRASAPPARPAASAPLSPQLLGSYLWDAVVRPSSYRLVGTSS